MRVAVLLTAVIATIAGCSDDNALAAGPWNEPAPPQFVRASPPDNDGQQLFEHHCAMCHAAGPGHPGTMRLALRLGDEQAALLARDDLPPAYVEEIVRSGSEMMPAFRPTEINDEELVAIADHVAQHYASERTER